MPEGYIRADAYDALYTAMKNYEAEAGRVFELVKRATGRAFDLTLLDVACGTGLHLEYFAKWFKHVEGVDISEEQLSAARQRLPRVTFYEGSMLSLMLADYGSDIDAVEPTFDVVTCLFSAIGHMQDRRQLRMAIKAMAEHLNPGGVLLVEPWLTPDRWQPGRVSMETADQPDFKVARITRSTLEGIITSLEMHYTVGTPDNIDHYVEHHQLALYTQEEYADAFRRAGLEVTFEPEGLSGNQRGVYVGIKPA